jgi:hypothetical protein
MVKLEDLFFVAFKDEAPKANMEIGLSTHKRVRIDNF